MSSKLEKKAIICTVSELATDYRLHKLALTLSECGYNTTFLCRKKKNLISNHRIESKTIYLNTIWQKGPQFYLIFNLRIFFYLLFRKYDLIVSVDLDTLTGCSLGRILKKNTLLFDSHEYFPEVPEIQHKLWIKNIWLTAERLFVPGIDYGVTVCQSIANIYKDKYNKDFLVIRNAPLSSRIIDVNDLQTKSGNPFTLIYQGAVNHGRALKELIDAMRILEDIKLLIVGDGDLLNELKERSNDLGDKITFVGKVPFQELPKYTAQADLGIALLENIGLNNYYALPNRLFDALQAQLPILGVNFPEIERFINKYEFGTVISDISPQNIAKNINEIRETPSLIKTWKENAIKARRLVNWENETIELKEILSTD
ncbi:glycosyltransferase [Carboxylicivirga caseinilyticus]|uniref:glycosyltransferase n=1 Tax=Carboxylicivirga caseinilyticus TaxID=3417572 RepID=UPI003D329E57|nr:glycosyltransferase [Marinilabiliaceae bacterium A049]